MAAVPLYAQVQDTTAADSAASDTLRQDSLSTTQGDTLLQNRNKKPEPTLVIPWEEEIPAGSEIIMNDSLLRWQIWPNWGDYQAYRRDVISFRQGSSGRIDAYHINGYEPHEQQLEMEGISLNNPITGLPNYNLVPYRKIGRVTETHGAGYHSQIQLRDYYITKPVSFLNYDEAEGHYRNLEFLVSRNFTERTNLELSYWDRRAGGYYPNSEMEGSQIVARVYHHLSDQFLIRAFYLRNQIRKEEPFGYNVVDPVTFSFDEFTSVPISSNGNSDFTRWDLVTGIYHRADTSATEDAGFEASISKNKKNLYSVGDTLLWDISSLNGKLFKVMNWGKLAVRGEVAGQHHSVKESTAISENGWSNFDIGASVNYRLLKKLNVYGKGNSKRRSDGKNGFELTAGIQGDLAERLQFSVSTGSFSRIPDMRSMYWQSSNYLGNPNLQNESGVSAAGKLHFKLFQTFGLGVSGRIKSSDNVTFLTPDSTFTNSEAVEQLSGTVFGRFENHRFEIESSGTIQQFTYADETSPQIMLNNQDQIIWFRNSAFVKGYVFDRAAYLKIGLKSLLSPFYYAARSYNTELSYWQGNSTYSELPPFFRLDAELSARVRAIMVVIRWENTLDGYGQAGYFEAAGYPMPPRRLIVGIRAQFRN